MKLLLDENFPEGFKTKLSKMGHNVEHVNSLGKGMTDKKVFEYAQKNKMCLITNDGDFLSYIKSPYCGVIKLNNKVLTLDILKDILLRYSQIKIKDVYIYPNFKKKCLYEKIKKYTKKGKFKQFIDIPILGIKLIIYGF